MTHAPKSTSPLQPLFQSTNLDVTALNAVASSSLPTGFTVERIASNGAADLIYSWDGTQWEDQLTLTAVTSTAITGTVRFVNPSSTDISFAW
jgi:hypothetical protein